ncbi:PTS ascorbate transporter subunit IIC [Pelolinea submarina]|uniref:Ascorbate-specific PTS system EIIC component n=1 Tax=Pelolinea submarina TaxID=913107 RepID=A0A3E0A6C7_9CHLR|nr:PTS ascorbate transporter subunit IIC [Pelolinea submarina]REG06312.1 PTS system IIC component (L-Asc family) [Pelolinea submarina]
MIVLNTIVNIFSKYIFNQPFILLGLVAMLGLVAQRKSIEEVISGSLKTGIGYLIMSVGTSLLAGIVLPIATILNKVIGVEATTTGMGTDAFTSEWASTITIIMVVGFFINLLLARVTKFKYVFLTAHQTYYIIFVYLAVVIEVIPDPNKSMLILIGGLLTGLYCTLSPALVQPYMRKVTGSDDLAYGHTTSFGVIVGSWVGSLFKDKKNETSEDLKIPDHLAFLKDITVSTAIVMTLLYVICVALAGPAWIQENISNGMDAYLYAISQGVQFGVGITIVLTGVSMMIAEITGAFKGISEKIVPNAIPALDCPVVFNYAPTAVMLGFLSCLSTVIVCVVIFGAIGFYALTPPVITTFFGGGPAGVFGNSRGGWRGAVLAGIVAGILLSFGQFLTVTALPNTVADFARWSNDFDYSVFPFFFKQIVSLIF